MQALNIEAEYRAADKDALTAKNAQEYADVQVQSGQWVLDDGSYYTAEEWDAEEERAAEAYEQKVLDDQAEYERREAAEVEEYWRTGY